MVMVDLTFIANLNLMVMVNLTFIAYSNYFRVNLWIVIEVISIRLWGIYIKNV